MAAGGIGLNTDQEPKDAIKSELIATLAGASLLFLTQVIGLVAMIVSAKLTGERDKRHQAQMEADRHYVELLMEKRLKEERSHLADEMKIQAAANAMALAEQTRTLTLQSVENRTVMRQAKDEASKAYSEANEVNRKLIALGESRQVADAVKESP